MPQLVSATASSKNSPLTCLLDNPGKGVQITEAVSHNPDGSNNNLQVAPDGQSFSLPIPNQGLYIVHVTINKNPGVVNIDEANGGPLLLAIYSPTKDGYFQLQVTP
jgi:hypothetical protein